SVPPVRRGHLWIQCPLIQGSRTQRSFDSSSGLIAVFHALPRLLAPRHPPHALGSLAALIAASAVSPRPRPDPRSATDPNAPASGPGQSNDPWFSLKAHAEYSEENSTATNRSPRRYLLL